MFTQSIASSAVAAWALISILPSVSCGPTSPHDVFSRTSAAGIDLKPLVSQLSKTAQIYYEGSELFTNYTVRWSNLSPPTPNVVIAPGTEKDVSKIVKFAAQRDIPILAYNGHHGTLTSLGNMDYGIQIYMPTLNTISVSKNGSSVTIGGGTNSKKVTDALWAAGKQTVTGTCECVSYLGPALGGGHGWLQGHHGLIADQFESMNVVTSDGKLQTIDATSDLFWAMQGAGHNFGIVTSVTSKVYDIENTDWAIETIILDGDKVEEIYKTANEVFINNGTQSTKIHNWSYWQNDLTLDIEKPVIIMYIIQEGVKSVDSQYSAPFHALSPLKATPQSGTYHDLAAWTGIALDSPPCQDFGFNNPRFPIYTHVYNRTAQKLAYDVYAAAIGGADSPYTNSIFMFEDYASEGIRARPADASAFAFRDAHILAAPLIIYGSTGAAEDESVRQLGNQLRDIIREGTSSEELHTYVNYAYGDEGSKSWYGYEDWRQEKLKALKQKYDPQGRFSFYAPIA
ncbi:hypothetical protein N0V91_003655 [Didymella pomorum]|uniref:FAD-binding PCMH-type domain-containing protein n=1 Tax=Didymella pomorum TaxID=749634 RepID=A0A9W8ZIY7_9PLEO|nr:hypothetical protein N0V91_003655 [Didymella pomorum]